MYLCNRRIYILYKKYLLEYSVDDDVESNENAKTKIVDIDSNYFLIVDHKGKQIWKDWNFKG